MESAYIWAQQAYLNFLLHFGILQLLQGTMGCYELERYEDPVIPVSPPRIQLKKFLLSKKNNGDECLGMWVMEIQEG